jgi:uncharacterized protein YerC
MTSDRLRDLRDVCSGLRGAEGLVEAAREMRDLLIARAAEDGITYRELAEATGLSVATVGKIAADRGVRQYKRRS